MNEVPLLDPVLARSGICRELNSARRVIKETLLAGDVDLSEWQSRFQVFKAIDVLDWAAEELIKRLGGSVSDPSPEAEVRVN